MVRFRHRFITNSKVLLRLAGPLIVSYVAVAGFNLTDALMAGRLGVTELAAVGIGDGIWMVVYLFIAGLLTAINPITAQAYGAEKYRYIGHVARQALWFAAVVGAISMLIYFLLRPSFSHMGIEPTIVPLMQDYLDAMWWAMPGICFFIVLKHVCDGVGHTKAAMVICIVSFFVNIFLNWVLMFGNLGMPALGVRGCGIATAIAFWLESIGIIIYILYQHPVYGRFKLFERFEWPATALWREILAIGVPIGFSIAITEAVFSFSRVASGALGATAAAAHNILFTFVNAVFMLVLALGMATTIRVGHAIGRRNFNFAREFAFHALLFVAAVTVVIATGSYLLRDWIVGLYSDDRVTIEMASGLFFLAVLFQVADGLHISPVTALRGYKDTKVPAYINLVIFALITAPLLYWGIYFAGYGLIWIWWCLVIAQFACFLLLVWRLHWVSGSQMPPEQNDVAVVFN